LQGGIWAPPRVCVGVTALLALLCLTAAAERPASFRTRQLGLRTNILGGKHRTLLQSAMLSPAACGHSFSASWSFIISITTAVESCEAVCEHAMCYNVVLAYCCRLRGECDKDLAGVCSAVCAGSVGVYDGSGSGVTNSAADSSGGSTDSSSVSGGSSSDGGDTSQVSGGDGTGAAPAASPDSSDAASPDSSDGSAASPDGSAASPDSSGPAAGPSVSSQSSIDFARAHASEHQGERLLVFLRADMHEVGALGALTSFGNLCHLGQSLQLTGLLPEHRAQLCNNNLMGCLHIPCRQTAVPLISLLELAQPYSPPTLMLLPQKPGPGHLCAMAGELLMVLLRPAHISCFTSNHTGESYTHRHRS
jgi:hypothetical protein